MIRLIYIILLLVTIHLFDQLFFSQENDFTITEMKNFIDEIAIRLKSGENDAVVDLSDLHISAIQNSGDELIDYLIQYTKSDSLRTRLFFIGELAIIDQKKDQAISDSRISKILIDGLSDKHVSIRSVCAHHLLSANDKTLKIIDKSTILDEPNLTFCTSKILLSGLIGDKDTVVKIKQLKDKFSSHSHMSLRFKATLARLGDQNSIKEFHAIFEKNDMELKLKSLDYIGYIQDKGLILQIANQYIDTDTKSMQRNEEVMRYYGKCGYILNITTVPVLLIEFTGVTESRS